ncbi:MAG TPA: hypothetical protein VGS07_00960 [Thermoanaerobaculia bacterium]|nr:hypothetical protein [Thermoanaerobaculia bacterium]
MTPLTPALAVERIVPTDRAVLQRVLTSSGVERTPVPPESSYLGELARAALDALVQGLEKGARMVHLPRQALIAAAFVAAAVALLLVVRALLPRLRLVRRPAPGTLAAAAMPAPAVELDAAGWRAELERRLAAGLSAEALEAAWWWLARSLAGGRALADWTSRDLVSQAGRQDLTALVRRLDAFIYGPHRPAPEEVRGLVVCLEEALA